MWKKEKRHQLISGLLFTTLSLQILITLNRIDRDTTQSVVIITIWSVHATFIYLFVIKVHVQMKEHVQKQQGVAVQSARFSLSTLNSWWHQRVLWLLLSSPLEIRQQNKDVNTRQIHRGPVNNSVAFLFFECYKKGKEECGYCSLVASVINILRS